MSLRAKPTPATEALYSFRLKLAKHGPDYVTAHVFRDADALRRYAAQTIGRGPAHWSNTEGFAHTWSIQRLVNGRWSGRLRKWRRCSDRGVIGLHLAQTGAGVIAHEFCHIASFTAQESRFKPGSHNWEERLAWTCGWLMHQFCKQAFAAGMYRRRSRMGLG